MENMVMESYWIIRFSFLKENSQFLLCKVNGE